MCYNIEKLINNTYGGTKIWQIVEQTLLNKRYNELVEIFTLTKEEYNEFRLLCIKINELLKDDSYYFGFEKIKMGNIIK